MLRQAIVSGFFLGGVLGIIALGLNIIWGVMKVFNLAHANFVMLALFAGYYLTTYFHIHPYLTLLILAPLFFLLGVLVMRLMIKPLLRVSGELPLLMTIALMILLESGITVIMTQTSSLGYFAVDPKYWLGTVNYSGVMINLSSAVAFVSSIIIALLLYWFIRKTDTGRQIRACSENPVAASLMGINVERTYFTTFGIGIACTAIAGSLLLPLYDIEPTMGHRFLLPIFVIVALGGLGSFLGTLIGALLIGVIEGVAGVLIPGTLVPATSLGILVIVLLFRPEGIFGERANE